MEECTVTGKELIKQFEGCKLKAYKCPAGIWTIGYGHTYGVTEGKTITQKEADVLLDIDYANYEQQVENLLKVDTTDNQLGALTSFAYNLGVFALKKSTLLKLVNEGKFKEAAEEFGKWTKAAGKVLPGLVARREAERKLFLS